MGKLMPIKDFVAELTAAEKRHDGYIMGATGQDPRKWAVNSWWFAQYTNASQHAKALYWREHAARVWDCNGMAEGLYQDFSGVSINTQAKYNYSQWCGTKGSGLIPAKHRVPGAAVFWGTSAPNIHHVAYLEKPVNANKPDEDWYIIEARGVMYGVVRTKLYARNPNFWGLMTKYFDYSNASASAPVDSPLESPSRNLYSGCEGDDVKTLQTNLIRAGYSCGKYGADGDFGDATEQAVRAFQKDHGLEIDGIAGKKTIAALDAVIAGMEKPESENAPEVVQIVGGNCYVRAKPDTSGAILDVVHDGEKLVYKGETSENGWHSVDVRGKSGWVSGKYSKLIR